MVKSLIRAAALGTILAAGLPITQTAAGQPAAGGPSARAVTQVPMSVQRHLSGCARDIAVGYLRFFAQCNEDLDLLLNGLSRLMVRDAAVVEVLALERGEDGGRDLQVVLRFGLQGMGGHFYLRGYLALAADGGEWVYYHEAIDQRTNNQVRRAVLDPLVSLLPSLEIRPDQWRLRRCGEHSRGEVGGARGMPAAPVDDRVAARMPGRSGGDPAR